MANTPNHMLPKGDRWSAFDTFSWITFGELRAAAADFEYPKKEWSRDWKCWPPEFLSYVFHEIETGVPWKPDPDEIGPLGPDNQRAWAQRIIEDTGESAGELLKALIADIKSYHANQDKWRQAKLAVNEAVRRGRLQVWAVKAHAPSKPNPVGVHELLDPLLFTDTRGVNEASWVDWTPDSLGSIDYRGPSYDRVFFNSAEIKTLWPDTSADAAAILTWMTTQAEAFLAEKKGKPLRDHLVQDCVAALKVQHRDAKAAYTKLPEHLRRSKGRPGHKIKSDG